MDLITIEQKFMPEQLHTWRDALLNKTEFDPDTYALDWYALAREYDALGMASNAKACRDRADHYAQVVIDDLVTIEVL